MGASRKISPGAPLGLNTALLVITLNALVTK